MKQYKKGDKIINATDRAYEVLYKRQGYKEVKQKSK